MSEMAFESSADINQSVLDQESAAEEDVNSRDYGEKSQIERTKKGSV